MLSHDNITWDAYAVGQKLGNIEMAKEILVSYLPLSHIAAQMVDIHIALYYAATVYFADKDALKGTLINTLLEARPTRMLGVPRVYEKIQEKMIHIGSRSGFCKQMVANWAKNVTLQHHINLMEGRPTYSLQYRLAKSLILSKVKDSLGLGRMQTMVTGAAPMSAETKKYFMSLDMPIMEAFGMSECCDHCCTTPDSYNFDTIGKNLEGGETRIHEPDENGHGELCFRGRHIFMGYLNEEEKTQEAIDNDGWLHSGDLGYVDEKGFLYITGRIKELIITAGGENIPPIIVENMVKNEVPALSNVGIQLLISHGIQIIV
jgi:long-chain-fatty-acid--CoA ligase ACSBG